MHGCNLNLTRTPHVVNHRHAQFARLLRACGLASGLFCLAALGISSSALIGSAHAQSAQPSPIEEARTAVESFIALFRGRDLPEGIVKSNGWLEATQVNVGAKYPGRRIKE